MRKRLIVALALAVAAAACATSPESTNAPPTSAPADTRAVASSPEDDAPPDSTSTSTSTMTQAETSDDEAVSTAEWTPPEHHIGIEGGTFVHRPTGELFTPRGVNYVVFAGSDRTVSPSVHDPEVVDRDFAWLAERGYNTIRIFLDTCNVGPGCMTSTDEPGVNSDVLDVVVEILDLAARHGLVVVLTSNDLPDGGGYRDRSTRGDVAGVFPGYRNTDFLTTAGHEAIAAYWDDVLTGLAERRARFDVVLGWSILNEYWLFGSQPPLSLASGSVETAAGTYDLAEPGQRRAMIVDTTRALITRVATTIRSHDPHGLVTMGFFSPDFPNATEIGGDWHVDTAPLVADSDLDFFDFHAYAAEDISLEEIAENFGIDESKPVLMGETGAFADRFSTVDAAALALQNTFADSCALGFDGWLVWAFHPLPLADRTWGFTEADGALGDALAPINQPDPCRPTLVDPDLATAATATASANLPDETPDLAIDGNEVTQWGSGDDAPQWIELTFERPVDIARLEFDVAQWPEGATRHEITVVIDGAETPVRVLEGVTAGGDRLTVELADPLRDVASLRVTTRSSPSWVSWSEISVFGP